MLVLALFPFWLMTVVPACMVAFIVAAMTKGTQERRVVRATASATLVGAAVAVTLFFRSEPVNSEIFVLSGFVSVPCAVFGGALAGGLATCIRIRPYGSS